MAGNSDRPPAPPAGWFADPAGSPYLRWWDGDGWTDNFIDARTGAPPAELASAPAPRGAIAASASAEPTVVEHSASWFGDGSSAGAAPDEPESPVVAASAGSAVSAGSAGSAEAPPLTRREARARERLAEEARANAETVAPVESVPVESVPDEPVRFEPEPIEPEPIEPEPIEPEPVDHIVEVEDEQLLAQPVSAARAVDSLGEVSEPDAVAPPEESATVMPSSAIGSIGIPSPEPLQIDLPIDLPVDSAPEHVEATSANPLPGAIPLPSPVPLPGSTVAAPSLADFVTGPTPAGATVTPPAPASSPRSDELFDFAGITPTGAMPVASPVTALGPVNAWATAPTPAAKDAFPLALGDGPTYTPMETRRPSMARGARSDGARSDSARSDAAGTDAGVATWAVWVFAALPVLHLALAWLVFDLASPANVNSTDANLTQASVLRWAVLLGPIILYLVFAALDRWTLLRDGQPSVAPVAYAIVPPLYLAIRVVRMGIRALAPLVVWVVLAAAAAAVLIFALPAVLADLTGS
ncbi:DUF2510 domain-containing protein [Lacisediminihabitans changchengi]|uniref:DUF2510 domain-containing protein n=1 Tax=Lacisediminihabitans changchengi TaxID=2787634 RepID=A0A934W4Y0_9MICO|nr:DUF2510 domain-containing protein [Lacisediminihabitans changchengi]MBK4346937.1 DUF2510 domain-containing protein [Lacisediminihabitans changchengi]MBK4347940.1 DUF2510 domain-containing protein [Lacisediminihabitans changchengi]